MRNKHSLGYVLVLVLVMLACNVPSSWISSIAPGGTWYVTTAGSDSNDCLNVASACLTVGAAVDKAATAGVIEIGPGNFSVIDPSFPGRRGLNLTDKVLTLRGSLDAGAPATTLDGGGADLAVYVNGIHGSGIILLENLIIQGGGAGGSGAALSLSVDRPSGAGVSLRNVIIQGSGSYGISASGPVALQLDEVQVINNAGEGVNTSAAIQLTINGSTISGNGGGGVTASGDNVLISATTISDNGTPRGAQVFNGAARMRIERSTISSARASADCHPYPATTCGMGIYNPASHSLTMVNSTLAANSGAGIDSAGDLKMTFSTVAENGGYGIHIAAGSIELVDSLVENNTTQDCYGLRGPTFTVVSWLGTLSDGTCSTSIFITTTRAGPDPYLDHLANNGGPTQTMALLWGSAAINSAAEGGPGIGDYYPSIDQREYPRPGADGGILDVGAYEYQGPSASAVAPLLIATPQTPTVEATKSGIILIPSATSQAGTLILILDRNANCRKGPGSVFEAIDAYPAGQSLVTDGRNEDVPWWWQVQMPNSKKHCWISSVAGMPQGDFNQLRVTKGPPAPVPSAGPVNCKGYSDQNSCIAAGCSWNPNLKACK
jgi:hypothetical protein